MSNSRLPPEFGNPPTRVVLEGDRPGSPAAQLLYNQQRGEIARFHHKARQSQQISGQSHVTMQQTLTGGGRVRYVYNSGIETLHVEVFPEYPVTPPGPEPTKRVETPEPRLAIDVLFGSELYEAGYIWTATETTTYYPPEPPINEPDEVALYWYNEALRQTVPGPIPADLWVDYFVRDAERRGHVQGVGGPMELTLKSDHNMPLSVLSDQFAARAAANAGPDEPGAIIRTVVPITFGHPDWNYGWGFGVKTVYFTVQAIQRGRGEIPGRPGYSVVDRVPKLQRYDYFKMLDVAGAVGDVTPKDGKEPFEAKYPGTTVEDDRLIPASTLKVGRRVTRQMSIVDDPEDHRTWIGAGFVARPLEPIIPGVPPTKTVIDIYIASANNVQSNSPDTALPTSAIERDDPSMYYDGVRSWGADVRVREFTSEVPMAVEMVVSSERQRRFNEHAGESETPVAVIEPSVRRRVWHFAASADWEDNGRDPLDVTATNAAGRSTMGKLLASASVNVMFGPILDPQPRELVNEPRWDGDVRDTMARLCRITWTPGDQPHVAGTATIEPTWG